MLKGFTSILMVVGLTFCTISVAVAAEKIRSTTGANVTEKASTMDKYDIPINLWKHGFVTESF